jgi:hypothetical protein
MAELIELEFEVDKKSLSKFERETRGVTEKALVITVNKALDNIEKSTLIREYTQNAKPKKPKGSKYIRHFILRQSSLKRITRNTIPVEGKWEAKIKYASYVIGLENQQALIHKNRWPALELGIKLANENMSKDFDDAMKKVQK